MMHSDGSIWRTLAIAVGVVALGLVAIVAVLPWIVRPMLRLTLMLRYNLKVIGRENLPKTGPVLLASNHVTWFDGFFLAATIGRAGTALMNTGIFSWPVVGFLSRRCGLIPIPFTGPKGQRAAIETARKALDAGNLLGIFPEGQLSRNGLTGPFLRGLEVILKDREAVPIVPVYIDNAWGSLWSYSEGRCLKKWPKGWRRTVVISFGPPVEPPRTAFAVRQAVLTAGVKARSQFRKPPAAPETVDLALPHLDHPSLGRLTGSAANIDLPHVKQLGQKPGSVGLPLPGLAIRAVDDAGQPLAAEAIGRLQALVAGQPGWVDLGHRGRVDRDGFVFLADEA